MNQSRKKTLKNKFKWIPMHERVDKLGLPLPPRSVDSRMPRLWVTSLPRVMKTLKTHDDWVQDVYLVNSSGKTLESVIATTGGCQSLGLDNDEVVAGSDATIEYSNVANGDAVRIFQHEEFYDSDWLLGISLEVKMNGKWIKLETSYTKGTKGFPEEALLY